MDKMRFHALCLSLVLAKMGAASNATAIDIQLPDMIEPPAIIESTWQIC